jgi:hypothetical protein
VVTFIERKRLREMEAREATGESFWTDTIPKPAIWKILRAMESAAAEFQVGHRRGLLDRAHWVMLRETGWPTLPQTIPEMVNLDTDIILSYVETTHDLVTRQYGSPDVADWFAKTVNEVLLAHRVKYRFVPEDGQIIPLESEELHSTVVEPALVLLHGRPDLADAHGSYLNALRQISESEPANAITDAGTALQQTLQALGCAGNALGPLIKSAKSKGLLASHDAQLAAGITSFMDWASADRSEKGDGHKPGTKELSDAWLMVHVVGALIVRLADASPRSARTR